MKGWIRGSLPAVKLASIALPLLGLSHGLSAKLCGAVALLLVVLVLRSGHRENYIIAPDEQDRALAADDVMAQTVYVAYNRRATVAPMKERT